MQTINHGFALENKFKNIRPFKEVGGGGENRNKIK